MYDLIVKNGKLVTPDRIYEADIAIKNGIYSAFLEKGTEAEAKEVIDAKGNYVFPGIIDCHAHLNEPGFEYREDFETGSRAAAAAGCTCPNGDLFPTVNMGNVRKALEILKPYGALCGFHCEEYGQVLEREREAKGKEGSAGQMHASYAKKRGHGKALGLCSGRNAFLRRKRPFSGC